MPRRRLTREESQAQTRGRLLDAARTVFAGRGYHGASVEEIAEEAGYSKGAVYSNFESKEEIFLELDRAYMAEEVEKIDKLLAELAAQKASVERTGEAIARWVDAFMSDAEWFVLGAELQLHGRRNPAFGLKAAALKDQYRAIFARVISRMFELLGKQPPANAEEIATVMIALSIGAGLIQRPDKKGPNATALIMATMGSFLAAAPDAKRKR